MTIEYSLMMFQESLKSKETVQQYTYYLKKFMEFHNLKDTDSIVKFEEKELQKMIETYVINVKGRVGPNSVDAYAKPLKTFCEANDIELKWKKIKKLYPAKVKRTGSSSYSTENVQKMLDATPQIRNKAIIHLLASSGVRIGALPELKLRHIKEMPLECKAITVYEDSIEEHITFLTPEASRSLDAYLNQRKNEGENIDDDSPLFREQYQLAITEPKSISKRAIQGVLTRAVNNAGIRGQKKNGRYSTQLVHGLRKRFNSILKLNKGVNDKVIERMMGHKDGLDSTYLVLSIEQMFEEFKNGIMDLTIDPTERQQYKIEKQKNHISELEEKQSKIDKLIPRLEKFVNIEEQLIKIVEFSNSGNFMPKNEIITDFVKLAKNNIKQTCALSF